MKVTRFTGGPMPTNCYMLTDESTGATAVIDPGFVNESLLKAVEGADVQAILLTHGHWDHIAGVAEIQKQTGAKLYIDAEDELFLSDSALNLSVDLTG
ncbi:MAG: MBL fold metallo-hydrolase, partial [Clostridiales bacterium]|nr:MBL fold metallo-hydrolase [Clostridiales bacterium]